MGAVRAVPWLNLQPRLLFVPVKPDIKSQTLEELQAQLAAWNEKPYRAAQVVDWLYQRHATSWETMTNVSKAMRQRLGEHYALNALELVRKQGSHDTTEKFLWRLKDGALIESVLIPANPALYGEASDRHTLCVSTQVGCAMACTFCATGHMGFRRNLRAGEIVDQVCRMRELAPADRPISNVVFMGMGEPLLNLPAVVEAIRLLIDPKAFALAPRRVTVSTVGLVPRIAALLEQVPVNLAVSLHATTDAVRDRLVPLNRRYPLAELLGALRTLPTVTARRPVFFEYTLMVPANRMGSAVYSAPQLKGMQEVITLVVFAGFSAWYLGQPLKWNHWAGFVLIAVAAWLIFLET